MKNIRLFLSLLSIVTLIGFQAMAADEPEIPTQSPVINDAYQVQYLFVQNADGGTFDGERLALKDISATIYFSDRPHRVAGSVATQKFVETWDQGENSFQEDPPNAAISIFGDKENSGAIVEISDPQIEGDVLSYKARLLRGQLPPTFGECSVFIDSHGDAGWGAAGGLLGGLLLGKVMDSSSRQSAPQTTVVQVPPSPYYYQPYQQAPPPPAYYGYAPQPYYERPPAYYGGQPISGSSQQNPQR